MLLQKSFIEAYCCSAKEKNLKNLFLLSCQELRPLFQAFDN